jgi:hypothetical protein
MRVRRLVGTLRTAVICIPILRTCTLAWHWRRRLRGACSECMLASSFEMLFPASFLSSVFFLHGVRLPRLLIPFPCRGSLHKNGCWIRIMLRNPPRYHFHMAGLRPTLEACILSGFGRRYLWHKHVCSTQNLDHMT